ncbi:MULTISPECIES: DUF2938 domain-containing protein [unclassified Hydrogenophaga]|uniref:DUF2938 domain-containing protein n=1 Tax=unclassified Hydrogenophaga TaxID=2610897 RepID=UPI000959C30A|nr:MULTISPECIES: DUF2938 domain-containing protein [unclassified Hydrogenophaga]MBN9370634.1 DUF2938 domain-containing protein [Hydrogenophaga sp.]OJV45074.1 MAG: hypothetical protein BGO22_02215 [Hydrogenophaga sp. 70-12]
MPSLPLIAHTVLIGIGATAVMDVWLLVLARLGVPTAGFAMVGRWVGHIARGRFAHAAIAKAPPLPFERGLGWLTHYLVGIAYAALLIAALGPDWLAQPTVLPALVFGLATVAAPWLVMQPAMGAGFLALKTPTPLKNCLRNLANHAVFGAGLYLAAAALAASH